MAVPRYFDSLVDLDDADDFCAVFDPSGIDDEVQPHYSGHSRTASATSVLTDGYDGPSRPYSHYSDASSYQNRYFDPSLMGDYDQAPTTSTTPETKVSSVTVFSDKSTKSSKSSRSSRSSRPTKPAKVTVKVEDVTTAKEPVRKKAKKVKKEPEVALEEDNKRSKFLERNRIAASKCRQKKKEWMSDLEETKTGLENTRNQLQMEYTGLLSEVNRMKDQLMSHAGCNDSNIDRWLENEARRFVQQTSERYDQVYLGYGSPSTSGSIYPGISSP